jgi:hypothetical protein
MVPKNFGYFSRSSAGVMECRGISSVVGASGWKTPSASHLAWICFSQATRESRFSVYTEIIVSIGYGIPVAAGGPTPLSSFVLETGTITFGAAMLGGLLLLAALVTGYLGEKESAEMYILSELNA